MECPLCICDYPYRLVSGAVACVSINEMSPNEFELTWVGEDGIFRGAKMMGEGAEVRAHDYAQAIASKFEDYYNEIFPRFD